MSRDPRPLLLVLASACATLADGAPGLDNAPSSRAGPFRLLVIGEIGQSRVPPYVMDDQTDRLRDVSVLDIDGDPTTLEVDGYFAASAEEAAPEDPAVKIVRVHALDGRSFDRTKEVVLEPQHDWEGGRMGGPSALIGADGETRLYYEAEGGLGVATSTDGGAFASLEAPVLTLADVPWAKAPLRSPGVVLLPDDSYRLYFETEDDGGTAIGVATSSDGVTFEDGGPVIRPGGEGSFDEVTVGSPYPVLGTSALERDIVYVYYTGFATDDKYSIGMAARFVDDPTEALDKSPSAMYRPPGGVDPHEPCVIRFESVSFLFSTQKPARDSTDVLVSAGVSPGNVDVPPPNPP